MIELERHIEILLLSNDCVIVPDLGGFMAHHLEAHYDEDDMMFLPPQRTLGFNPQLKLNDSLLAQSYVEAYDISYPEALRRIEAEVAELKQHLENEGYYEMNDIGQLKVNNEGKIEFAPCEAGILTPELYGLSSFEMKTISTAAGRQDARPEKQAVVLPITKEPVEKTEETGSTSASGSTDGEERLITIKMSWVRNTVAVAAALLAFLLMTKPVSDGVQTGLSMSQINLPIIQKHPESVQPLTDPSVLSNEPSSALDGSPVETPADSPAETPAAAPAPIESPAAPAEPAPTEPAPAPAEAGTPLFCIVAASQVSQKGADAYVARLQKEGFTDARVCINNNVRRVIIGSYSTKAKAYAELQKVHANQELSNAWVYELKSEE